MAKKLLLLSPIAFGLLFIALAGEEPIIDVPAQLELAESYQQSGDYGQAEAIYKQVVSEDPNTEHAFRAQGKLTALYVCLDEQQQAQDALEELIAGYSEYKGWPHMLHEMTQECSDLGKGHEVRQLYQYVLDGQPQTTAAIWLQMGVALSSIYLGDDDTAAAAIEILDAEFSLDVRMVMAVNQIGLSYFKLEQYEVARLLYLHAVEKWPESKAAIFSQRGIVLCDLALGNEADASLGVQRLREDFAENKNLPKVLNKVAKAYLDLGKYEKARELYRYVQGTWPDSEEVTVSLKGVAISSIELGDDPNAEAAIDTLIAGFPQGEHTPQALFVIGRKLKGDARAAALYQYIIENFPGDDMEILAKAKAGSILVRSGDLDAAQATLDRLLVDYSGNPALPRAVAVMANGYYSQALLLEADELYGDAEWFYRKAIAECGRVVTQMPETPRVTSEACYFLAVCHERLGEYGMAIDSYQKVVDIWPDYNRVWHAMFKIGCCYGELKKSGVVSESEADQITRALYEQLLEEYPKCIVATHARYWLSRHN